MIIDVFPFFDEIDLLEIRLNTLEKLVDKFVISEFSTTFAGKEKEYNYEKYSTLFSRFENKIIYLKQEQNQILNPFENDAFQKNAIRKYVLDISRPGDLIMFGDVDEIPKESGLASASKEKSPYMLQHFAQQVSYGYLNVVNYKNSLESIMGDYEKVRKRQWLGTVLAPRALIEELDFTDLKLAKHKQSSIRINDGGWHFSFCGGYKDSIDHRLGYKLQSFAHQEFNSDKFINGANKRLLEGKDFLGRRKKRKYLPGYIEAKFRIEKNLTFLPKYVQDNLDRFSELIAV